MLLCSSLSLSILCILGTLLGVWEPAWGGEEVPQHVLDPHVSWLLMSQQSCPALLRVAQPFWQELVVV